MTEKDITVKYITDITRILRLAGDRIPGENWGCQAASIAQKLEDEATAAEIAARLQAIAESKPEAVEAVYSMNFVSKVIKAAKKTKDAHTIWMEAESKIMDPVESLKGVTADLASPGHRTVMDYTTYERLGENPTVVAAAVKAITGQDVEIELAYVNKIQLNQKTRYMEKSIWLNHPLMPLVIVTLK